MTTATIEQAINTHYSITQHYLAGPSGPMRYWQSQPEQGVPVLLIHGYGALIEHWRPVMRPIARSHTLYALDLYGFGYSARPQLKPSREHWAAQVAELLRQVIRQPAVVVGHSMGGVVAATVARAYPDLVRGLVLVNSSGLIDPQRPISAQDRFLITLIGNPLVGAVLSGIFANQWGVRRGLLNAYHRKERVTPELVETFSGPLRKYGGASYLAVTQSFTNLVLDMQPGQISAPTLLIWGAEDQSNPPANTQLIRERMIPQAEIAILEQSGHCPFDETPETFCDALLPWLAQR